MHRTLYIQHRIINTDKFYTTFLSASSHLFITDFLVDILIIQTAFLVLKTLF
jgi:hypothetical protein